VHEARNEPNNLGWRGGDELTLRNMIPVDSNFNVGSIGQLCCMDTFAVLSVGLMTLICSGVVTWGFTYSDPLDYDIFMKGLSRLNLSLLHEHGLIPQIDGSIQYQKRPVSLI
jgi:hypothetical protein